MEGDPKLLGVLLLLLAVVVSTVGLAIVFLLLVSWRRSLQSNRLKRRDGQTPVVDAWQESAQRLKITDEPSDDETDPDDHENDHENNSDGPDR